MTDAKPIVRAEIDDAFATMAGREVPVDAARLERVWSGVQTGAAAPAASGVAWGAGVIVAGAVVALGVVLWSGAEEAERAAVERSASAVGAGSRAVEAPTGGARGSASDRAPDARGRAGAEANEAAFVGAPRSGPRRVPRAAAGSRATAPEGVASADGPRSGLRPRPPEAGDTRVAAPEGVASADGRRSGLRPRPREAGDTRVAAPEGVASAGLASRRDPRPGDAANGAVAPASSAESRPVTATATAARPPTTGAAARPIDPCAAWMTAADAHRRGAEFESAARLYRRVADSPDGALFREEALYRLAGSYAALSRFDDARAALAEADRRVDDPLLEPEREALGAELEKKSDRNRSSPGTTLR